MNSYFKKTVIFFLILCASSVLFAAKQNVCTLPLKLRAQQSELDLSGYLYIFEDKEKEKQIDAVRQNECWFVPVSNPNINLNFSTSAYWLKLTLENTGSEKQYYYLSIKSADINYLTFFEEKDSEIENMLVTGQSFPSDSKQIKYRNFAIKIELDPHSSNTYYMQAYNDGNSMILPVSVQSHDAFVNEERDSDSRNSFIYGILFFIFTLSLFLAMKMKKQMYVLYSLYVLFGTLSLSCLQGYISFYFLPDSVWLSDRLGPVAALLANISLLSFVAKFLEVRKNILLVSFLIKYMNYLFGLFVLLMLMPQPYTFLGYISVSLSTVTAFIIALVCGFLMLFKERTKSLYLLFSYTPITLTVVGYFLRSIGLAEYVDITAGIDISFSLQVLLLAFALVDSFHRTHMSINKELKMQNDQMRKLNVAVTQIDSGIAVYDADGFIEWNNPNYDKLRHFSVEPESTSEKIHINDLLLGDDCSKYYSKLLKEKNSIFFESEIVVNESENKCIQTILAPVFDDEREVISTVAIETDISEQKKNKDEKRKLQEQLVQAQKMETIGKLAGGIAHDFNNILTPIVGYTEMVIADLDEDSDLREDLGIVMKASLRAQKMVKQILTFSSHFKKDEKIVLLEESVKEAVTMIKASVPPMISVDFIRPSTPVKVLADPTQLQQIFINLITNSIHAIGFNEGNININLKSILKSDDRHICSSIHLEDEFYVCVSISDTGSGISEADIKKVFDPFYTTKETGKGTGLGLSVVHGIVKNLKGEIIIESELGKGTQVAIYLPIAEGFSEIAEQVPEITYQGQMQYIMVVDDEASIVKLITRILERHNFKVTGLTSSLEAYKCFAENPQKYQLLITDQTMPEITGEELALKVSELNEDLKVIIMTGYSEIMDAERANEIGVDCLIYKPVKGSELISEIERVLEN